MRWFGVDCLSITLNSEQQHAVDHRGGPLYYFWQALEAVRRVITQRIVKMIEEVLRLVVLAVTFTNRAAREMAERIDTQLPSEHRAQLVVSTFHALGARMLREYAPRFERTRGLPSMIPTTKRR